MSWLTFEKSRLPIDTITSRWNVVAADGSYLGQVRWFSRWRRYCYTPSSTSGVIWFEEECLREIAQFIERETSEHKKARKQAKAA